MPKVSVILTSFNHDKYIHEAIESVLNQSFIDFELIIWDDASSDDSWGIINSYSDVRIKAYRNKQNMRGGNINRALKVVSGEYIAIHHSDDVWELDKLEKQIAYLDAHSEIGAVFTWAQIIDENGSKVENSWFKQENKSQWQWLNQLFLEQNYLNHPSVLIRKQCYQEVGPYRYGLAQTADAEMWSRLLIIFPIHIIQEKLTKHRLFSDNSNTSGTRPDVAIRVSNEWNVIRENYLSIAGFEDIVAIFPGLERFRNPEGFDNKYLLAMACLYECKHRNAWQLGLKWLFDLLSDATLSQKIKKLYSFSYLDFIRLTGEFDVYAFRSLYELAEAHAWMTSQRDVWENEATSLKQSLTEMILQRDAWENEATSLKQSLTEMILQRDAWENEATSLKQSLRDKDKQVEELHPFVELTKSLEEKLRKSEAAIAEIFSSKSWKATEPLRTLMRFVQKQACLAPQDFSCATQQIVESDLPLIPSDFDAEFYSKAYPDIGGGDPLFHYLEYGKNEGRLSCAPVLHEIYELKNIDRAKETILIVSHDASRSGAPILALNIAQHLKEKYNVIAFLFNGGELLSDFQECCDIVIEPFPHSYNLFIASTLLAKLISEVGLKFAIVNSIVSSPILPFLANNFVPSLCLVHEFASYTSPKDTIREVLLWASQVVFSARIVYENNAAQCEELKGRCPVILPQGKCEVPHAKHMEELDENKKQQFRKLFRPDFLPENTVVILGAGSVQLRKGVDLFLACAARVVGLHPQNSFRFVWVGHGFDPDFDMVYSAYLQDQITRSGLENHVCFTGEMSDIDVAYELSDLFFLSSRLDPLPNVAIDAMYQQLPVICFDNTTGIADILKENGLGGSCVIPYLDVELAAQCLVALIDNSDLRHKLGQKIQEVGKKLFDMESYVDSLERLAIDCVVMQEEEK